MVTDLVHCILKHFDHISIERVHNLCFLSEFKKYERDSVRYTSVEYERLIDGYYSKEVAQELNNLDGVAQKSVRVGGDVVDTLKINREFECSIADGIIEETVNEYGEMSHGDLVSYLIEITQETDVGENYGFGDTPE